MFLSQGLTGVYYLWLDDELCCTRQVSARCTLKTDALRFLQDLKQSKHERKVRLQQVSLSRFTEDYLIHSKSVNTVKSRESVNTSRRDFSLHDSCELRLPPHKPGHHRRSEWLLLSLDFMAIPSYILKINKGT